MPRRIRKIEYDRIDRVPAGAQPDAHVTLVKARRTKIEKLVDPASLDAQVQRVRDEFREKYSDNYGCCSPCSGYVWCDAVYDGFIVASDSKGCYWRFDYTVSDDEIEFGEPSKVKPNVKWLADAASDDDAPQPVMKALWSATVADRIVRETKERKMPKPKTQVTKAATMPDLSALDDDARALVEAAFEENTTLTEAAAEFEAAVAAAADVPEPVVADDEDEIDLDTVEGIEKAIKKTRSPEMKQILKATLKRVQKAETENASLREGMTRLEKAERIRLFKTRAEAVGHMAPHAADAGGDGVGALAGLLEHIDTGCGSDVCEEFEAMLTKAHNQVQELVKPLLKSVGRNGGTSHGQVVVLGTSTDPEAELAEMEAAIAKEHPDLSDAQVKTRVLKSKRGRELYAEAQAS